MTDRRRRPRWFQRIRAKRLGKFWLPCPICNEMFGGHEVGGHLAIDLYRGKLVCLNCGEEAERRNTENAAHWREAERRNTETREEQPWLTRFWSNG